MIDLTKCPLCPTGVMNLVDANVEGGFNEPPFDVYLCNTCNHVETETVNV